MFHDARPLVQPFHNLGVQDCAELQVEIKQEKIPDAIKMLVGPWHLDEFGNPTREITRLDWLSAQWAHVADAASV
jgi:hypothetical protein